MKTNIVINDDCLNFMKSLPDKCIDLCLTDPPYGINILKSERISKSRGFKGNWDDFIPTKEYFDEIFRISKNQVIWGGNYFIEYLQNTRCFLIWDKNNYGRDFADCEMAWTSIDKVARVFKYRPMNMDGGKVHPTQKPIELFSWILENYSKENDIIFDPFAGSGTTAISCINMNRQYLLVEKEVEYFNIINKRISEHNDGNLLNYLG